MFKGYGSTFGNVDKGKDVCVKGCFTKTLEDHGKGGTLPSMYFMHDPTRPIGDYTDMKEDARGLSVTGQLYTGDNETQDSRVARNVLKGTGRKGLSIGFFTKNSTMDAKTGTRFLNEVELPEVSVVGHGMNPKALVTMCKSLAGVLPTEADFLDILRECGLNNVQIKAFLAHGYKGLSTPDTDLALLEELKSLRAALRPQS